jgi:hypothetical protein
MLSGVRAARRLSNDRPSADSSRFIYLVTQFDPLLKAAVVATNKKTEQLPARWPMQHVVF